MVQQTATPEQKTVIDISEKESETKGYHVSYQIVDENDLLEIEGTLKPYDTGRTIAFKFEPDYYNSEAAEAYFNENWEDIEEEMLNKLNDAVSG